MKPRNSEQFTRLEQTLSNDVSGSWFGNLKVASPRVFRILHLFVIRKASGHGKPELLDVRNVSFANQYPNQYFNLVSL